MRELDVCATVIEVVRIVFPAGSGLWERGERRVDVEGVGRVGEDGEEVGEDDDGGADEEEPLEGGGWGHGGEQGGETALGGAHLRVQRRRR